ncbi:nucleoside/nucleotide kinase family protein [Arthrobacter sp. PGP41]|uniref:nucleoside/nucleotide kinase family protein n=1 Tax=unclassified Arthrobacter TaxID=235627 RepID=UPI000CDC6652|nr:MULTISPECIES: nucleoside/nucleotide kinase family protein [unclassified Arthrobacter]AUZ36146.1 nucleoside/nucleotide kinase family protein [Arthrobacter sp. PGP41]MDT0194462.1 nucleoside/nucleotide kinase family protein [Arthrobacter sp. AB6]
MDSPEITQAMDALRRRLVPGTRIILGIAGAPGSGKSTFAEWIRRQFGPGQAVVVPMDGFHLGNAIIDGTPLRQRKGAMDTFDAGGYLSLLRRLARRDEPVVYAPEFRRTLDEPVAASIAVPAEVPLVITEGNYLLMEQEPWKDIRAQLDEVWFVDTPPALRLGRLVARHVSFGMDRQAAEAWAAGPDEANAVLIQATRRSADRVIPWD